MTPETPDDPKPLLLDEGLKYACLQCGHSCSGWEELEIDAGCKARLSTLELDALAPSLNRNPCFEPRGNEAERVVLRQVNGACCFLTPQRQCSIHRDVGAHAKPKACREFPFWFVDTPEGTRVGVSYACTAVLQGHGEPLGKQRGELEALRAESPHVRSVGTDGVALAADLTVPWEAYRALEASLLDILKLDHLPLSVRLIAQADLVGLAVRAVRAADSEPAERVMGALLRRMESGRWSGLTSLASRHRGSARLQRIYVNLVLTAREEIATGSGRLGTWAALWGAYWNHGLMRGRVVMEESSFPIPYSKVREVTLDRDPSGYYDHLATRWWRAMLERKDLLAAGGSVEEAHGRLVLRTALVHWHWMLQTLRAGKTGSERLALQEAIRLVERRYGHERLLERTLAERGELDGVLRGAMGKASWAATMLENAFSRGRDRRSTR